MGKTLFRLSAQRLAALDTRDIKLAKLLIVNGKTIAPWLPSNCGIFASNWVRLCWNRWGKVHALTNPGNIPLEIIEVQSGNYLGEDDIVRFEDTYGRNLDA